MILCIALILSAVGAAVAVPDTIPVDLPRMMGRWFGYSTTPLALATFAANSTCTTATYSLFNDSYITVYNANRQWYPTGPEDCADGYGRTTDEDGKLLVYIDGGSPDAGNYWVVRLGDFEGEFDYFYLVVTDPTMGTLFIMTRDLERFEAEGYAEELTNWALAEGYDDPSYNLPVRNLHTEECTYPPVPAPVCTLDGVPYTMEDRAL